MQANICHCLLCTKAQFPPATFLILQLKFRNKFFRLIFQGKATQAHSLAATGSFFWDARPDEPSWRDVVSWRLVFRSVNRFRLRYADSASFDPIVRPVAAFLDPLATFLPVYATGSVPGASRSLVFLPQSGVFRRTHFLFGATCCSSRTRSDYTL